MTTLRISTDKSLLDLAMIHAFLSQHSTWANDIPLALVKTSIEHSLCFGGYVDAQQVAFARVVTDYSTFAYLVDVFVLQEHRGKGYSKQLMQAVMAHPQLQGLRRFSLATSTAHGLYAQIEFKSLAKPENMMEIHRPALYSSH